MHVAAHFKRSEMALSLLNAHAEANAADKVNSMIAHFFPCVSTQNLFINFFSFSLSLSPYSLRPNCFTEQRDGVNYGSQYQRASHGQHAAGRWRRPELAAEGKGNWKSKSAGKLIK